MIKDIAQKPVGKQCLKYNSNHIGCVEKKSRTILNETRDITLYKGPVNIIYLRQRQLLLQYWPGRLKIYNIIGYFLVLLSTLLPWCLLICVCFLFFLCEFLYCPFSLSFLSLLVTLYFLVSSLFFLSSHFLNSLLCDREDEFRILVSYKVTPPYTYRLHTAYQ